jgi:site-specific recombinase XerD
MTIRPRGKSWQLDLGKVAGKRVQLSFATKGAAEAEMRLRTAALRQSGHLLYEMSDAERIKYLDQRARLAEVGATVEEAVNYFLQHARPGRPGVLLGAMIEECLDEKRELNRDGHYVSQLKCAAMSFARHVGEALPVQRVTTVMVKAWLQANAWEPKTQQVYLGDLATVFSWGLKHKCVTRNPCAEVQLRARADDDDDGDEVELLTVDQCERLLRRAAKVPASADEVDLRPMLAYVVIGMFTGLRPVKEIGRMTWADVKLANKVVIVSSGRAKTRARRVVQLSDNAIAWLTLCDPQEGKIRARGHERLWDTLRAECGFNVSAEPVPGVPFWPHNGLRHTFASMHLEHHGDEQRLQLLMGHTSAKMLYANYKGLVLPKDAARFWGLRPGQGKRKKG